MKNITFLRLSALLCFAQPLSAQSDYPVAAIPDTCLRYAHAVVRLAETNFRVEDSDEASVEELKVVTILRSEGDAYARIVESEGEFNKVKSISGRIYDAEGKLVRSSDKSEVIDYGGHAEYEFSSNKIKALELTYNRYPYTVEFKVKKTIKGFFRIPEFTVQDVGVSVEKSAFHFTAPADYRFKWKGVRTKAQPTVTEKGKEKTWTWQFEQLPAPPVEPYMPYFRNDYAAIIVAPELVEIDGYSGAFGAWKQIGAFFNQLNAGRDQLSPDMQAKVAELTAGKQTRREKIDALYRYLQQNHRYVSIQIGIGGWQTLDARFVEQKKYGDCKALSNYMMSLLKQAGIRAYPAVIFGGQEGSPEWYDDAPTPFANHEILYVPDEDMWLECTSRDHPTGYLGSFTADRPALLLTPEGGKLTRTPPLTMQQNTRSTVSDIRVAENGTASVQARIETAHDQHDLYRYQIGAYKQAELEKEFMEDAGFNIAKLHTLQITAQPDQPKALVQYQADVSGYAARSGKRMFVPIHKTNPFKRSLPADDNRVHELRIKTAYIVSDTLTLHFPPGYAPESLPQAKKIESPYGKYEWQITPSDTKATIVRRIEIPPVSVPAESYKAVRQFYADAAKADGAQMVLLKKE